MTFPSLNDYNAGQRNNGVFIKQVNLLAGKEPEQNNKRTFQEVGTVRGSAYRQEGIEDALGPERIDTFGQEQLTATRAAIDAGCLYIHRADEF